jgi:endonuclease YncB( thermonuclease family)
LALLGQAVRVRLSGIDCPEKRQAFGYRAKRITSDLAFGQLVTVYAHGHDRDGRTLADVVLSDGNRSLNQELVRMGAVWWLRRYAPHDKVLADLEAEARAAKRGLWADPHPVPPWEYRHGMAR